MTTCLTFEYLHIPPFVGARSWAIVRICRTGSKYDYLPFVAPGHLADCSHARSTHYMFGSLPEGQDKALSKVYQMSPRTSPPSSVERIQLERITVFRSPRNCVAPLSRKASMKRRCACFGRFGLIRYRLGQKSLLLETVSGKVQIRRGAQSFPERFGRNFLAKRFER